MLSVSPGMEVGSGGHSGLGGGFEGALAGGNAEGVQEAMLAAARDRAVRQHSVRQDLALDLPPRLQLPDGEERPYGAHTTIHLRDPEQVQLQKTATKHFSKNPDWDLNQGPADLIPAPYPFTQFYFPFCTIIILKRSVN